MFCLLLRGCRLRCRLGKHFRRRRVTGRRLCRRLDFRRGRHLRRLRQRGGRHDELRLGRLLQRDHFGKRLRRRCRIGPYFGSCLCRTFPGRRLRPRAGLCRRRARRDGRRNRQSRARRGGLEGNDQRPADRYFFAQFRRQRRGDRRDHRLCLRARWRRELGAQIGYFHPSVLPGEGEARQPQLMSAEAQAQHQCVHQQGKQQRQREPPARLTGAPGRQPTGPGRAGAEISGRR